jgi:hypothetical protein
MYSIEPTSSPRVGCAATMSLIGRENSRAAMTFCWFPPERLPTGLKTDGVRMSARERRLPVAVEDEVVGHGEVGDQAVLHAVLGDVGDARLEHVAGSVGQGLSGQQHVAGVGLAEAGDRLDEFALSIALDAGDGQDLARPHDQVEVIDRVVATLVAHDEVAHLQDRLARLGRGAIDDELHVPADHHRGQLLEVRLVRGGGAGDGAAAQDGDAVRDLEHLVELVGDEDDRGTAGDE